MLKLLREVKLTKPFEFYDKKYKDPYNEDYESDIYSGWIILKQALVLLKKMSQNVLFGTFF